MMRKRLQPRSGDHVALIVEEEHPSPELFYLKRAPPPRQPLFLPDKHYRDFMAGRPRRQKASWLDGPKFAKGCTGFSLVAILFLLFIGMLVDQQPLYIKGVKPGYRGNDNNAYVASSSSRKRRTVALAPDVSAHAHQAAFAYLLTLCVSIFYGWDCCWRIRALIRRRHYSDIPDASSTIPTFHLPTETYHNGGTFWTRLTRWRRLQRKKPKRG